jgi:hypothetical protein
MFPNDYSVIHPLKSIEPFELMQRFEKQERDCR